ncbi:efflux RND transporter periplasmic adaptor subunit [Pseudomonas profundi]|uniref:efflux RND transporter periplasmic adaptor subunit n=1 Tax=Pseudomonas profundi TaxID=1981513 RepID=UPI00123A08CB|nr:efflux RND transporter periplasmic adaptor subunit [Pseudomonas profundi]
MQSLPQRLILCLAPLFLVACDEEQTSPEPPPPTVSVVTVETQPVANVVEIPGRVEAIAVAEVRARVDGIIQKRLYEEGTDVEAGQQLFQIDPREMQANINSAEAALDRAKATAANAAQDVKRYEGLVAKQAISQQEYDTALARLRTARADVSQAEAAVETAELNLGYTRVESPIDGVAGRAEVTVGALVSAANGTLLTRVEQFDPVYVNFSQSSSDLLSVRAQIASGALEMPEKGKVPVQLVLENGEPYPHTGYVDFLAMSIDRATGTVAVRAQVPNPDRLLLPGQFVEAQVEVGTRPASILLPQRAVIMNERGASVMVVDEQDVAQSREVRTGSMYDGKWVILEGLERGETVIVEGWQKARPGTPVTPEPYDPGQPPGAGAPAQDEAAAQ